MRRQAPAAALFFVMLAAGCGTPVPGSSVAAVVDNTGVGHGEAERVTTASSGLAYAGQNGGSESVFTVIPDRYAWPVTVLSIGHTSASYQNYGGSPYFHHGLDIRADAGSPVIASAGGKVVNIENYVPGNSAYWEVAILDDAGFLWQYHHIDENSIPQAIHEALKTGARIEAGTRIGEVFYWPVVTFGERYHHIHLNVLAAGDLFRNPFDFLAPLADTQAPVVEEIGILKDGAAWTDGPVSGSYTVYAKIHDLIQHQKFVVPPRRITYSLDQGPDVTVWDFSAGLPGGADEEGYVHDFFVPRLTCGNYSCRKLTVDLGFRVQDGPQWFPTAAGGHEVVVKAEDDAGNQVARSFTWTVR